jgi:phospholipid/cholesterol/gamma-HCH transport system substrate-binding protein
MKNRHTVILGIFIALGLGIFAATILTLGGQKKTFIKSFTIYAVFDDIGGLQKGGNIWFSGVKIGTIKKISLQNGAKVLVAMSVETDVQEYIHKNAKAKIGSDGLIGNKIIVIYGGDDTVSQVEKNDSLAVEKAVSTDDMMAMLQDNNKNLLAITNDFKSISRKVDSGKGTLGVLINDDGIAKQLSATMGNLQTTVANLNEVAQNTKAVVANVNTFSRKLNKPGNSIHDLVADTVAYGNIKKTLLGLQNASETITKITANLHVASYRLNQKDNTVGLLLNDSTAASSINKTLLNIEKGSKKLDEDLEALQHNFLLRRYFKKKKE